MYFQSLSKRFKQNQKRNGIILGVASLALVGLFILLNQNDEPVKVAPKEKPTIHNFAREIEDQNLWMFKSANELEEQRKKQDSLTQEIAALKQALQTLKEENEKAVELAKNKPEISASPHVNQDFEESPFVEPSVQSGGETHPKPAPLQSPGILSVSLSSPLIEEKKRPHISHYIPAGSYASAKLLNGVDASAGVTSQASPQPVLLKLTHRGSLPNKFFGKMKECRAIAAAYGDLSSERVYMRLEKLSCVKPDGHVIETDVDGYVSGHDGKNGVRGRVVIRDAEMLKRGFMGGVLSGLGKATTNSFNATSVSPFGAVSTSSAKGADIFKQAGAQGSADAFELMARYNIQRAEQYQPVIQVSADIEVEIVFHSGVQFGEQTRTQKRGNTVNQPTNSHQEFQNLIQRSSTND